MIKTNIKMRVTPEQSKKVQEICFANGIGWGSDNRSILFLDKPFLHISTEITYGNNDRLFKSNSHEEVDASFFIKTNGTCIEETPEQESKQNTNKEETMEKNEVKSYADVKEYLIAKGLYERVLEIDWNCKEAYVFRELFIWFKTEEGYDFWDELNAEMFDLDIYDKIESLVQDYLAKQGKEFIKHLEAQPEEVVEVKPTQKPKSSLNILKHNLKK